MKKFKVNVAKRKGIRCWRDEMAGRMYVSINGKRF